MKEIEIVTKILETCESELSNELRTLVNKAREMTLKSYAPYSHFNVGAAILLSSGEIVTGSNQENVAYPSGMCAERTACFWANANRPNERMEAIAIAARAEDGKEVSNPISPCGACRQALLQYEMLAGKPIKVILVGCNRIIIAKSVKSLLPLAFTEF